MAAFTPRRSTPGATGSASNQNGSGTPSYMSGQGPITKVKYCEQIHLS